MILAKRAFSIKSSVKKFLFFIVLLVLQARLYSQVDSTVIINGEAPKKAWIMESSIDSTLLYLSTNEEEKFSIKNSTQRTDTVLNNLHNYYQMGVLGNMGLPSYSLLAEDNSQGGFFKWMNLNNRNDLFTNKQPVYFYPAGKVYTKVFAAMGQKLEQVFKILHSQNIKRVNVSLQFNRYSCLGFYLSQKSITDNLLFSSHATTKKGRLGYNFYFLYNKLKYQLNGGIDTGKVNFEENILVQKQLFPVMLSTTKHNIRTSEANLLTFVRLNDTEASASHTLNYEVNYENNYWMNVEGVSDTSKYASTYFHATDGTNEDSVSFKRWDNSFYYRVKSRWLNFYAGYTNEFAHYNQFTIDTMTSNHIIRGGIGGKDEHALVSVSGHYAISGFNAGNYLVNALVKEKLGKFYVVADFHLDRQMPAYMSVVYLSPHFIWSDTLSNIFTHNLKLEVGSDKHHFRIGAFGQEQKNLIYFDTLALPRQYQSSLYALRLYAQKDLKLGPVHINNTAHYQTFSNSDILRLPQLYTFHQLYYEGKLFKNALWLQVGFQARYISSFKANAYMPATNQFYLQNNKEYGNYVFVDFFINAQIERFRFFILASHLNQGLSGANYMLTPNYAMPDRSIKAGLCWMFYD